MRSKWSTQPVTYTHNRWRINTTGDVHQQPVTYTNTTSDVHPQPVTNRHNRWRTNTTGDVHTQPVTYTHNMVRTNATGDVQPQPVTYKHNLCTHNQCAHRTRRTRDRWRTCILHNQWHAHTTSIHAYYYYKHAYTITCRYSCMLCWSSMLPMYAPHECTHMYVDCTSWSRLMLQVRDASFRTSKGSSTRTVHLPAARDSSIPSIWRPQQRWYVHKVTSIKHVLEHSGSIRCLYPVNVDIPRFVITTREDLSKYSLLF